MHGGVRVLLLASMFGCDVTDPAAPAGGETDDLLPPTQQDTDTATEPSETDPGAGTDPETATPSADTADSGAPGTPSGGTTPVVDVDLDGYSPDEGDCDDNDANFHPGAADDTCDGVDWDCDGRDGVGLLVTETSDAPVDGVADTVFVNFYGTTTRWRTEDDGLDGDYEEIFDRLLDGNGNTLLTEYDHDGDEVVDETYAYTYDANGNQTLFERDYDADGVVDARILYVYDVNGYRITSAYFEYGTQVNAGTFTNDANGIPLEFALDFNFDGVTDGLYVYTYDASMNLIEETYSQFPMPGLLERRVWTYDANGNALTEDLDAHPMGSMDEHDEWTYDANGGWLTHLRDTVAVPGTDIFKVVTRDSWGDILTYEYDYGNDGIVDGSNVLVNQCHEAEVPRPLDPN